VGKEKRHLCDARCMHGAYLSDKLAGPAPLVPVALARSNSAAENESCKYSLEMQRRDEHRRNTHKCQCRVMSYTKIKLCDTGRSF
jgi:hypothetical protein